MSIQISGVFCRVSCCSVVMPVAHDYITSLVFRHSFSEIQTNKMSEKEAIRPLPHLKTRESCRVSFLPSGRGPSVERATRSHQMNSVKLNSENPVMQKVEYVITSVLGMSDKQTMAFSEKRQRHARTSVV